MRPFSLEPRMLTLGGVFYPTGYVVVMVPTPQDAHQLEQALNAGGFHDEEPMLLDPDMILQVLGHTVRNDTNPLPSVGTEGATIHEYERLARDGHHAVMIHAPNKKDSDHVMEAVHTVPFSFAQKYRLLVIEDMS